MNRTLSASALIASFLITASAAQAGPAANDRMLNGKSVHGEVVAATEKARVVDVSANKAINVNCGDVVTFKNAGKSFTWKFSSAGHRAVDMRVIAPSGFSDKALMVYISPAEHERA